MHKEGSSTSSEWNNYCALIITVIIFRKKSCGQKLSVVRQPAEMAPRQKVPLLARALSLVIIIQVCEPVSDSGLFSGQ